MSTDALERLRESLPAPETSWPNEPIGGGNPYCRCSACGRSDPEISYMGHYNTCGWTEEQARRKTARDVLDAALAEMRADGYAQDREQAAGTADAYSDEMLAAGRNDRAEGVDDVAERIRAMQPEQKP